jgi:hypothetical protein
LKKLKLIVVCPLLFVVNSSYSFGSKATLSKSELKASAYAGTASELQLAKGQYDLVIGVLDAKVRSALDLNGSINMVLGKKAVGINAALNGEAVALQASGKFTSKEIDLGLVTLKVTGDGALNALAIGGSAKAGSEVNFKTGKISAYMGASASFLFGAKAGAKLEVNANKLIKWVFD